MITHELKTDPAQFALLRQRSKTFELRRDDRGFAVGDGLHLRETAHSAAEMRAGKRLRYTGKSITRIVTHLLRGPVLGLKRGWVILSLG